MNKSKKLYFDAQTTYDLAYDSYAKDNTNKEAWNMMWRCTQITCFNIINRITKHYLSKEELNDYALDVTCTIMSKVKDTGVRPNKLTSYCYLPCLAIFAKQRQFEDGLIYGEVESDDNGRYYVVSDKESDIQCY